MRFSMIDAPELDFVAFHTDDLPARLAAGNGRLAAADLARARPIAFVLPEGPAFTYAPAGDQIRVNAGIDDAATVVELSPRAFSDLVQQIRSAAALVFADELRFRAGDFDHLVRWEPALRAMYAGIPVYDPTRLALTDRSGAPLDLGQAFALTDDPDDLAHFLGVTGYLVVRDVFDSHEIDRFRAEVERLARAARPGDGTSWWAKRGDEDVLCRLVYVNERSEVLAGLSDDGRIRELVARGGWELVSAPDRMEGHSVVIKVPGATAGLADLPWHQDCGLGGHPILCPALNVGIQLDPANAQTGQLHFVAGSHGSTCHQIAADELDQYPHVAVDAEPGDVTVHVADVAHAAPPPRGGTGRRTLYVSFFSPSLLDQIGPHEAYNDLLRNRRADGQVQHVEQVLRPDAQAETDD